MTTIDDAGTVAASRTMIARARRAGGWLVFLAILILAAEWLAYAMGQAVPAWLAYACAALIMAAVGAIALEWSPPAAPGAGPDRSPAQAATSFADPDATPELEGLRTAMAEQQEWQRQLHHDLRGILSPALLTADRLLTNADPKVQRAGNIMVQAVERAAALLAKDDRTDSPRGRPDSGR